MRKSYASGAVIRLPGLEQGCGFAYRVYLSNLTGAEGTGLYELVIPVYTAVVLTITSGITIAVSKMVAELNARADPAGSARVTACAIGLAVGAGMLVSAVIYLNAGALSTKILGDERTTGALLVLVPCLPVVVAASALKGISTDAAGRATAVSLDSRTGRQVPDTGAGRRSNSGEGAGCACTVAVSAAAAGEILNMLILLGVFRQGTVLQNEGKAGGQFLKTGEKQGDGTQKQRDGSQKQGKARDGT